MNMLQHPTSFREQIQIGSFQISYHNLIEVCQGGPVVGDLSVNGKILEGLRFGGPLLHKDESIILPLFVKKIWDTGFVIVSINLKSLVMNKLSKVLPLAYLSRVEGLRIYYFEDCNKTKELSVDFA